MGYTQKLYKWKNLLILIFFFVCIPITFIYGFLRDVPCLISFFNDYITSGSSIFLTFLPSSNIFWFLPDKSQFISFSSGFLIDIIIIINLGPLVERSAYHYYTKVCLEENYQKFLDLGSNNQIYDLSQGSVILFGLREESRIPCDEVVFNIKSKKNQSLIHEYNDFYYCLVEKECRSNIYNNVKLSQTFFAHQNSYFQQFCDHSDIEKLYNISINQYVYPQTTISHLTKPFHQEG